MAVPVSVALRNLRSRFLEGLTPADFNAVISAAKQRQYFANSVVVNQGDEAQYVFLLVSGRARYFYVTPDGRKSILLWIPPGEMFGGAALLGEPSDYLVSTETVKTSSVLVWDRRSIRDLMSKYPRLTDNALLVMFDYLVAYRAIHVSITCHSARQRLAFVLAQLATGIGRQVTGGIELDVHNEELANEANVTPFTVSRMLGEWQRQGIVSKGRGKIVLHSPERLFLQPI